MNEAKKLPKNIREIIGKEHFTFDDLADIVRYLRSPDGCPWDRAQTHESIGKNSIEEIYELIDAVKKNSTEKIVEEAGDVILQSLLHAVIGEEDGAFTLGDVIDGECRKLITRHSHIFGGDSAADAASALKFWERNKYEEKKLQSAGERIKDVPDNLPALMRAEKVQKRAAKSAVDFASVAQVYDKLDEEAEEVRAAAKNGKELEEEIGDLLFTAVNLARLYDVDAESALTKATDKFIGRFLGVEKLAEADGKKLSELDAAEFDGYYNEVKNH